MCEREKKSREGRREGKEKEESGERAGMRKSQAGHSKVNTEETAVEMRKCLPALE